jgi:hypothetical protein
MSRNFFALGAYAAVAVAAPAWAHHSHANYASDKESNLTGTVKEVQWINPHVWVYMVIPDAKGQPKTWALEGASPLELTRKGWLKDTMKPGDKISVRCWQIKDGSDGCLFGYVTEINGVAQTPDVAGRTGKEFD